MRNYRKARKAKTVIESSSFITTYFHCFEMMRKIAETKEVIK